MDIKIQLALRSAQKPRPSQEEEIGSNSGAVKSFVGFARMSYTQDWQAWLMRVMFE